MKINAESRFAINEIPCQLVIICDEKGQTLEDCVEVDTVTGRYKRLLRGANGQPMLDGMGLSMVSDHQAEQFFFTVATPCRRQTQAELEPSLQCSGAAKE